MVALKNTWELGKVVVVVELLKVADCSEKQDISIKPTNMTAVVD
jgi:hypothetical protein